MSTRPMVSSLLDRLTREPVNVMALALLGFAFYILATSTAPPIYAMILLLAAVSLVTGKYLDVFRAVLKAPQTVRSDEGRRYREDREILRELRNYLFHARPSEGGTAQVNIDDEFKTQILARLVTESQNALSAFVESEVFKKAAESDQKAIQRTSLREEIGTTLERYQIEMMSWRKNANVNLIIGLVCAVLGIGVMWQTLVTINFEPDATGSWRVADLYRFLARVGLVLIIESVAFFFLKLYREDRTMIRYLRNEITNLEARYLALTTALTFGSNADVSKMLLSLVATERNFLVKKGDRVISDIAYENNEIMIEKIVSRLGDMGGKIKPGPKEVDKKTID